MEPIGVFDSVTHVPPDAAGHVVVCGSHGGVYAAHEALVRHVRAVIFNDAGVGLRHAGIRGLQYLDEFGIPGATVSHQSARIGDGTDMMQRGVISHLNGAARRLGGDLGVPCAVCSAAFCQAPDIVPPAVPKLAETRHVFQAPTEARVVVLDSNSLVRPEDRSAIVVTGSHGGLLGGDPRTAVKIPVRAAAYNDAGIGIDQAGTSRLAALETMGVASCTVAADTAEIGSGLSTLNDGVVSAVNRAAAIQGVCVGMTARIAVLTLLREADSAHSWLPATGALRR